MWTISWGSSVWGVYLPVYCCTWLPFNPQSVHDMHCHLLQDVIDFCCPGDTHYVTFCYCDFYAFADTVGYKSEKMAGWWVLPKSISVVWSKRNTVTIRRFYCCTCSTSETFLSQISSAETDLFGLNLLYQNLGGNFWLNNEDWVTPNPHWDWYGVECTDGHVTSLKLNGNNLTGDISFFGKGEDVGEDLGDTI
jgi:hypothetical protein